MANAGSKDWVNRMWDDPWFQRALYRRYTELTDRGLVAQPLRKARRPLTAEAETFTTEKQAAALLRLVFFRTFAANT